MSNVETTKQQILDAFHFRHATKSFDASKKISEDDFNMILETARLSPSSVGYEPWKFLVVQNMELREKIREVSFGAQGQFPTASHVVIILARKGLTATSDYVQDLLKNKKSVPESMVDDITRAYENFQKVDLNLYESDRALFDWASKQTYIALANMMTSAAMIGIDSCPIEGFNLEKVTEILSEEGLLDTEEFGVSVMAAFGYREKNPERAKERLDMKEIVQVVE
ncbi:NAD(P)H-dependent oxidoreductase [Paenalkalicoccus suaedae]|uniref:NAD(P)H-dependent oxidoreductase n=1 Tax=Paenalkalicoccus suaedae TaxID=2592382 RepID=A0A859FHY3_9BACI|nr:NAD(P)H-dependent oxidoreductase [Paenalkalicoccus suaedae]QKS72689.1 NAD(P)H-dependent oxidoreductase [Paenalkalicoccus suaedae]